MSEIEISEKLRQLVDNRWVDTYDKAAVFYTLLLSEQRKSSADFNLTV